MTTAFVTYPRSAWNPRQARVMSDQHFTTEGFLHHSEDQSGTVYDTIAKQEAKVRDIQRFHMVERGWADIAYHYVIFQPNHRHRLAHVFAARPVGKVPAAQLNHNSNTLAVCVVGNGDRETLHAHTLTAIRYLLTQHHVLKFGGHRDVVATDCPGARFYPEVRRQAAILGIGHF